MLHRILKRSKFVPNEFHVIYTEIDLENLKNKGIKLVLSDLDNTLISYDEDYPTKENLEFFDKVKSLGMEIVLVSNNIPPRLEKYTKEIEVKGFANARKPLAVGIKKAIKSTNKVYKKSEICLIGDQLMTDVWAAKRFGIYSILVNPIKKKTEKWYTKLNRKTEVKMLERIKNETPETYNDLGLNKRR